MGAGRRAPLTSAVHAQEWGRRSRRRAARRKPARRSERRKPARPVGVALQPGVVALGGGGVADSDGHLKSRRVLFSCALSILTTESKVPGRRAGRPPPKTTGAAKK